MPSLNGSIAFDQLVDITTVETDMSADSELQKLLSVDEPLEILIRELQHSGYLITLEESPFMGFTHTESL